MAPARIFKRERFSDRRPSDNKADVIFLSYLYDHFGDKPFVRGNLDAGRISWLYEREVKSFDKNFISGEIKSLSSCLGAQARRLS